LSTAGIYIHIPFCKTKCNYCDFYSISDREKDAEIYISALCKEISRSSLNNYPWQFDTLFIGGGTPSILTGNQIEKVFTALSHKMPFSNFVEKTIEINPGEAPFENLTDYKNLGINRVSMGVQSLDSKLQQFLSRSHSVKDVFDTYDNVRKAGFENLNLDLIYSIPGQTKEIWKRDLESIVELDPEHISAYILTVEKGTELFQMVKSNKVTMPKNSESAEWFSFTRKQLNNTGFIPYEISNFSKPEKECLHNLHYWNIEPYIGFGPSAHSFDGANRWNNAGSLDQYMQKINKGDSPISTSETLTPIQQVNEKIGFGLRLSGGIELITIPKQFKGQLLDNIRRKKKKWSGFINQTNGRIYLTQDGFAFADAIAADLFL